MYQNIVRLFLDHLTYALIGLYFILGTLGYWAFFPGTSLLEGAFLVIRTSMGGSGPDPSSSLVTQLFDLTWLVMRFVFFTIVLATIVIPPVLFRWNARINGMGKVTVAQTYGRTIHFIVNPVDWMKVRLLVKEIDAQHPFPSVFVVIANHDLGGTLPKDLKDQHVFYIKGNPLSWLTYKRANISKKVFSAFICPTSYKGLDDISGSIVRLIEVRQPTVRTIVELVDPKNKDLLQGWDYQQEKEFSADQSLSYQDLIPEQIKQAKSSFPDRDQDNIQVIRPVDLDDPLVSDPRVSAELHHHEKTKTPCVALFLAQDSADIFTGRGNCKVICFDEVVNKALASYVPKEYEAWLKELRGEDEGGDDIQEPLAEVA